MTKTYKYKFSIVTAVYNTEKYVSDTIHSVINQSIGFKDNVQLILVNDGSKDQSGNICQEYRDKYPNNIVYINKENGGVSSARNRGLSVARGKYVNFLDSDDKLSKNALKAVWKFFEKHYDSIDFASIPMYFFTGRIKTPHMMTWKFQATEIIDIEEKPQYIQLSSSSSFFKAEVIKRYPFDTTLQYAEDVKVVNEILLEKRRYGILNNAKYLYRRRETGDSAIQNTHSSKNWYFDTLSNSFLYLLDLCEKKFDHIPLYYQYLIMYDLQFRLKQTGFGILTIEEKKKYLFLIKKALQYIEDKVVFDQQFCSMAHKLFALSLKYNKSLDQILTELTNKNDRIYFHGQEIPLLNPIELDIRNFKTNNQGILLEGVLKSFLPLNKTKIYTIKNREKVNLTYTKYSNADQFALEQKLFTGYSFKIHLTISSKDTIHWEAEFNNTKIPIRYYFSRGLKSRFFVDKKVKRIIRFVNNQIQVRKYTVLLHSLLEGRYLLKLFKKRELKVIIIRILYYLINLFKFRELWLFIERPTAGGDNAQAFFEYAVQEKDQIDKIFVISKESNDYKTIKKIGRVVDWRSLRHLLYILLADKLISSHADMFITNPYGRFGKYFTDLYTYDYIFLQHGIIKDDLSSWLNKIDKNIKLFITSAKLEYKSILDYDYKYSKEEILLSGLPRYDKLYNSTQKKILVMPTWRQFLTSKPNNLGTREKNTNFTNSDFFCFYNNLINNKKLLKKLEQTGYKMNLCLHPAIIMESEKFNKNKYVEIPTQICNYTKEFSEGALLITDYSSVAFDFAYLRKPVIYCQFDYEEVFRNHTYREGYFKYEKNGFGPIYKNLETTVDGIIEILERDCELDKKYKDRINNFFEYNDQKNSERVYNAIRMIA